MANPTAKTVQGVTDGTALPVAFGSGQGTTSVNPIYAIIEPFAGIGVNNPLLGSYLITTVGSGVYLGVAVQRSNGALYESACNNLDLNVLASTVESATFNTPDQTNFSGRGVRLTVNVSAISGAGAQVTVKLQAKDPTSGVYVDLPGAATAALVATGAVQLTVYPGITAVANVSVNDVLPRTWRAVGTITGTTPSITLSIGASVIL